MKNEVVLQIRLTQGEKEAFSAAADSTGLSLSAWVRSMLKGAVTQPMGVNLATRMLPLTANGDPSLKNAPPAPVQEVEDPIVPVADEAQPEPSSGKLSESEWRTRVMLEFKELHSKSQANAGMKYSRMNWEKKYAYLSKMTKEEF